jgi:hypothetical protein
LLETCRFASTCEVEYDLINELEFEFEDEVECEEWGI